MRLRPEALAFVAERHLATLTTVRADGRPHVVPVGFSWDADAGTAWVICSDGGQKVRNLERGAGRAVLCQVDRARWLSLEGVGVVHRDPAVIAAACERYERRYQAPRPNPKRVAIELLVDRVLDRAG
jgi:PPOX class probable F420-dependent enzyme